MFLSAVLFTEDGIGERKGGGAKHLVAFFLFAEFWPGSRHLHFDHNTLLEVF